MLLNGPEVIWKGKSIVSYLLFAAEGSASLFVKNFHFGGKGVVGKLEKKKRSLENTQFTCSEKKNSGYARKGALFMPWAMLYDMGSNWIQMIFCGKLILACGKLSSF